MFVCLSDENCFLEAFSTWENAAEAWRITYSRKGGVRFHYTGSITTKVYDCNDVIVGTIMQYEIKTQPDHL